MLSSLPPSSYRDEEDLSSSAAPKPMPQNAVRKSMQRVPGQPQYRPAAGGGLAVTLAGGAATTGIARVPDEAAEACIEPFFEFLFHYQSMDQDDDALGTTMTDGVTSSELGLLPSESSIAPMSSARTSPQRPRNLSQKQRGVYLYRQQIYTMREDRTTTLYVDFMHLHRHKKAFAEAIAENYYRFEPYLRKAVFKLVQRVLPEYTQVANVNIPKEFWIAFYGFPVVHRVRDLNTQRIGKLMTISGTVTRTSDVRPELYMGTFQCKDCKAIVRDVEQNFKYTEPSICVNPVCQNRLHWTLLLQHSTFLNWQRVHVQENSSEIPPGGMPRGLDVIVRNDLVERAKPGDRCAFTGCLIVMPDVAQLALPGSQMNSQGKQGRTREAYTDASGVSGLRALGARELSYRLAFVARMVQQASNEDMHSTSESSSWDLQQRPHTSLQELFSPAEMQEIMRMKETPALYQRLVESVAPAIFGHEEVKSGILLQLFGGVHKQTPEGIRLRGDINVCIVGDPGVAKSKFLKYVTNFLPRSVFTSGKASSAAGLTASVVKDEETGEFTIEAGALMLADNGICAIDEFDKMDLKDQVAIHEAMEQQTITLSKAGVQATLNARTSILAAANPIFGRYDRKKSLRQNIQLSAPIMSRFDLFFVVLDQGTDATDYHIARHILQLHRYRDEAVAPPFRADQLQRYIRYARTLMPQFTLESAKAVAEKYKKLRENDATGAGSSYRMTVRQLESMIRLSEALARLHGDAEIKVKYVNEACRMLKSSIIKIEAEDIALLPDEEQRLASKLETGAVDGDSRMTDAVQVNDASMRGQGDVAPTSVSSSVMRISFETYKRITTLLTYKLRHSDTSDDAGMRKEALIQWYLEQAEDEIESEEELWRRRREVRGVIERLIHKDCVLLELMDEEVASGEEEMEKSKDPVLVVHPNYTFDD